MESFRAARCASNGETGHVPVEVEVLFVDGVVMESPAVLLGKDAGWTQDVGSIDSCLIESRGRIVVSLLFSGFPCSILTLRLSRSVASCSHVIVGFKPILGRTSLVTVTAGWHVRLLM